MRPGAEARATELRRLAVQALGRSVWSLGLLVRLGETLKTARWPDGAEGARIGLLRALSGSGNLRLNLIGALAVPGWDEATLAGIGEALVEAATSFEGEEIADLRVTLRGGRRCTA